MACRLHNTYDKTLGIDLRGGGVMMLPPNTTSRAIVEEALYDNHHLPEWERAGWIRRIPARMDDVIAEATSAQGSDAMRTGAKAKAKAAATERKADGDKSSDKPSKKGDKKTEQ